MMVRLLSSARIEIIMKMYCIKQIYHKFTQKILFVFVTVFACGSLQVGQNVFLGDW